MESASKLSVDHYPVNACSSMCWRYNEKQERVTESLRDTGGNRRETDHSFSKICYTNWADAVSLPLRVFWKASQNMKTGKNPNGRMSFLRQATAGRAFTLLLRRAEGQHTQLPWPQGAGNTWKHRWLCLPGTSSVCLWKLHSGAD